MKTTEFIEKHKVIAICRKIYGEDLIKLVHALYDGGIRLVEVTFDQSDPDCLSKTSGSIHKLNEEFGDSMRFGAGTVLTPEQVESACRANAEYIISPNTNIDVIYRTKELGLVSIPGAMTPSEILTAHAAGADFVKLFPAGYLGLPYLKDIKAPISHVKIIVTAGVNEENFGQYLNAGVAGAGISGRLTDNKLIADGNFMEITSRAARFVEIAGSK